MSATLPGEALRVCTRCIYDERTPGVSFDEAGICNYCRQVEDLERQYATGKPEGERELARIIEEIKASGRGRKYDCVIGVSGGTDSSYLLIRALEWGLRPLAVHYDNTWNSAIATENIRKVTTALKVDLYTHVVDNRESEDIYRAFLRAGVPEFDASTDIAFVQTLRSVAAKVGVRYILEGHSFKAEGIAPIGKNYFDGRYIEDIHARFGERPLKTYPNLTFWQFMKWVLVYRQRFIRPLWYIDYSKAEARRILEERTGWKYYGGHHLENRATAFLHTVYNPERFGLDNRNLALGAEARAGLISHEEALHIYRTPLKPDPELVAYVKKRLGLSDEEYQRLMTAPLRSYRDFKTYKRRFERLRPMFYVLAKSNLVPMSFYLKYCFPQGSQP
jgi:N-acetyl sugar amidotransferase